MVKFLLNPIKLTMAYIIIAIYTIGALHTYNYMLDHNKLNYIGRLVIAMLIPMGQIYLITKIFLIEVKQFINSLKWIKNKIINTGELV